MKFRSSVLKYIFLPASCFFLLASSLHAQVAPIIPGGLEISASSNAPVPGQKVTLTAQSYITDIRGAMVTWTVNGKVVKKGVGENILEVTAPALGGKLTIVVNASTPEHPKLENTIVVSSGSIDLINEPDGYVTPFFRGKISNMYQNSLKIVAVPHLADASGKEYDPKNLVYEWKKNDIVIQDQSGYGRQYVTIQGDLVPRPYDISVSVSSRDGGAKGSVLETVSFGTPFTRFYVDDPLYGTLLNKSVGETLRIGKEREVRIQAAPFGFNTSDTETGLTSTWFVNGTSRPELAGRSSIILRSPEESSGRSQVELKLQSVKQLLQQNRTGFGVLFNNPQ